MSPVRETWNLYNGSNGIIGEPETKRNKNDTSSCNRCLEAGIPRIEKLR